MSFDFYLLSIVTDETGKQRRFDRAIVEKAFAHFAVHQEKDEWELLTPEGELCWASMSVDLEPTVTGFSVNRPPWMPTFWDAVHEVLRQTPTIVVWPGSNPAYCVPLADYADRVPPDYVDGFGEPVVVTCGAEIRDAVERSTRGC